MKTSEKKLNTIKIWKSNNKDKVSDTEKRYRLNHPEKHQEWELNNKEKYLNEIKLWRTENIEKVKLYRKTYNSKHRKEINKHERERRQIDAHYKLRTNISRSICGRLKRRLLSKKNKPTFSFLPYSVDELKQHLEKQFVCDKAWMNWNNWGMGVGKWNIDYIRPESSFNYTSVEDTEFQKCWSLSNLQPLEAMENMIKGNRY